jgi:hypothetical protein
VNHPTLPNHLQHRDRQGVRGLALHAAAKMPLLPHHVPGRRFNIMESPVVMPYHSVTPNHAALKQPNHRGHGDAEINGSLF